MIPRLLRRTVRLEPRILYRHTFKSINALLLHRDSIQVPLAPGPGPNRLPQLLAGVVHSRVHPAPLLVNGLVLLPAEELPGAVDGPVAQVSQAGHAQRGRGRREHVAAQGADAEEVFGFGGLAVAADGLGGRAAGWGRSFAGEGGGGC